MTASREKRSDDIAAVASEARERASSAASAAEAAQKSQTASPEARADLDALTTRIAALEQSARDSQAELARRLSADDAKGRFAIAAIALRDAVDSGLPFTAELAAAKSLSGDAAAFAPLEPLAATGVPSATALGRELAGLMPAIWKIARKDEVQEGTFLQRLQANASKIIRIRPAGDVVGDDPTSAARGSKPAPIMPISAVRWPNSPSCRRMRVRRPRPGSRKPKRAMRRSLRRVTFRKLRLPRLPSPDPEGC